MLNSKHVCRGVCKGVIIRYIIFLSLTMFLFSCSHKKEISLPFESPQTFSISGTEEVTQYWWSTFGDTSLNKFISIALKSNLNLKSAWQRLREANAIVDRETAPIFPWIDAFAEGEVSESDIQVVSDNKQFALGLAASYELDLWGKIRARIDAEQYREKASLADYRTAALSISAEVTRTWYQLMEAWNQLELINEQIKINEKALRLINARFGSGQVRSVDILRQQQLLEATIEQRISTELRIDLLENQFAVLLGRPPQDEVKYIYNSLPELPPLPETGIPIELVKRRPDVQTAYNLLLASDRDMAAAINNQYPRISFTASLTTTENSVTDLFEDWVRSFTGSLLAPLFYGGQLSAEVDRTEAVKYQRLYEYGQTVLVAFQDVENALIQETKQVEIINSLEAQVALADQTYEQLRLEYFNGLSNYLDVLTTQTELQRLHRNLLSAKLMLVEFRIALYRSLAGGFETKMETENLN